MPNVGCMGSPFDSLIRQHRALEARLERLASGEAPEASRDAAELLALLRRHSRLEERCLSPLLARVAGRERCREQLEAHLTLRELMDELEVLPPGRPEWQARLLTLEDRVVAHFQEVENALLPQLMTALDSLALDDLRRDLSATRMELFARPQVSHGAPAPLQDSRFWDG
ncbi:hemerythrin domain-containing protein [Comamonas sp. JC664]|uniref:hemerythrin domain-containing protein n=1 Tax=Comamonas sp. JC664 TaxID=2801917 RepID=UPI001E3AB35E|nr:hemerythrin domain-containing protein [Comamonas sp. JC664]